MSSTNLTSEGPYEYTVLRNQKLGPLASYEEGVYEERLYRNFTGNDVYIVDDKGNQFVIPPVKDVVDRSNKRCLIQERSCTGSQMNTNSSVQDHLRATMDLQTWIVPASQLINGPIYVQELNIVLCFKEHIFEVVHPYRRLTLQDSQAALYAHLRESDQERVSCQFLANDPLRRFTHLFGIVSDVPVDIKVTDFIDKNHKTATLTVIVQNGTRISKREYDIEDVLKDGYLVLANCPIGVVGLSEQVVQFHKGDQLYTQKDLDQEVARAEAITERKFKSQLEELKLERDTAKNERDSMKAERDALKTKLGTLQGQYDSVTGSIKGQQEVSAINWKKWQTIATIVGTGLLVLKGTYDVLKWMSEHAPAKST